MESCVVNTATLLLSCPICGQREPDEFECLDEGRVHTLAGRACRHHFRMLVACCRRCGTEHAFSWRTSEADPVLARTKCEACRRPLGDPSSDGDEEDSLANQVLC